MATASFFGLIPEGPGAGLKDWRGVVSKPEERLIKQGRSRFKVVIDREDDGRWIADIPAIPGAMAYGRTIEEALEKAYALGFRGGTES